MNISFTPNKTTSGIVANTVRYLKDCRQSDGAILWFPQGKLDPWDHTEAAMAFTIAGEYSFFKEAFEWLARHQNADGSWQANYIWQSNGTLLPETTGKIETNFLAYPATGLWHYFLVTRDKNYVAEIFPVIERAIDFVIAHQNPDGDIQWAVSRTEALPHDSLVTACASILRSLECAILLSELLDKSRPVWNAAYLKLSDALKNKPWRFDRTWESKSRFSMDWFYPILSGAYTPTEAALRLRERWEIFVEPEVGCRCVSDQPWMTVAESCELVLALVAAGERQKAEQIFLQLQRWQDMDGGYWTGYNFKNRAIWPREKTSWTGAAILLAADALYQLTPASRLFTQPSSIT